jgi:hypothetical protein
MNANADARRLFTKSPDEPSQQNDLGVIVGEDMKPAPGRGRIKGWFGFEGDAQLTERVANWFYQRLCGMRWCHSSRRSYEQWILKRPPQACQRVAHCGLTQAHSPSGPRDVSFFHQRFECQKQIQIDRL